jgi:hypothetical protein
MLTSFSAVLHDIVVKHVVCAEHGETLELEAAHVGQNDHGNFAHFDAPATQGVHEDGCVLQLVSFSTASVERPAPLWTLNIVYELSSRATGAPLRVSPYTYAPKTDPPQRVV